MLLTARFKIFQQLFLLSTTGFKIFRNFFAFSRWALDFSATFLFSLDLRFSITFLLSTTAFIVFAFNRCFLPQENSFWWKSFLQTFGFNIFYVNFFPSTLGLIRFMKLIYSFNLKPNSWKQKRCWKILTQGLKLIKLLKNLKASGWKQKGKKTFFK